MCEDIVKGIEAQAKARQREAGGDKKSDEYKSLYQNSDKPISDKAELNNIETVD